MNAKLIQIISGPKKAQSSAENKLEKIIIISALIMLTLNSIRIYDFIINPNNQGLSLYVTVSLFIFFLGIWRLLRQGYKKISAWLLIISYALPTIFCFIHWGADLPAALLMTVLIIMLSGIFLGVKTALSVALFFSLALISITDLQINGVLSVDQRWRQEPMQLADALSYILILSIIFALAWMIVKENHQALSSLQKSREALNRANEELEFKVAARTKAIKIMQREKLEQLQALASIGQLSSSIFHDIINPLTIVSLNLEQIEAKSKTDLEKSNFYIQQALSATARINELISNTNRCLRRQSQEKYFSIRQEVEKIKKIMDGKARMSQAVIKIQIEKDIRIKGGPVRFGQILMNLISNAIDACAQNKQSSGIITINIKSEVNTKNLVLTIEDNGVGIPENHLNKIFNIFFTTKPEDSKNVGLGLSIVKEIVENDFNGKISVSSKIGQGSLFTIVIPICQ